MLLKANGGKVSDYRSLAMLVKIKDLRVVSGDLDGKKRG